MEHCDPEFLKILEQIKELHAKKNAQYADSKNPLGNFSRGSSNCAKLFNENIQSDPYKLMLAYAIVLASKQYDGAIEILAENKTNTVDSLYEKLQDVATYFLIAMRIENQRTHKDTEKQVPYKEKCICGDYDYCQFCVSDKIKYKPNHVCGKQCNCQDDDKA